ncbi:MAG: IS110 family transposase [Desulfovermiculus sp.]|nr:IS110 family transposase [Desulfovermiculus sp.]
MKTKKNQEVISVVHPVCCALDIHKKSISACLLTLDENGLEVEHLREFETYTDSILELKDWLNQYDCPIVAMESTGVYWKPVHNILEDVCEVVLVNARHVKNLPGKKTDVKDSRWLASLLKHGLLKGSFIPPKQIRQWRDLTRLRKKHVQTANSFKQRTQKFLESANIKLDSVLSDLFGVSGRCLLDRLAEGEIPSQEEIARIVHHSVRGKSYELFRSIQGFFTEHHVFLLRTNLEAIDFHTRMIERLDEQIKNMMTDMEPLIQALDQIPGINEVSARAILAEIGVSLDEFKTGTHLCSWSGLCPGNNQTRGKRKHGRSPVKKHVLKTTMVECAWAGIKKKGSYYKAKYHRLKSRLDSKKAIIAIAHKMLQAIYNIIKHGQEYKELGEEHILEQNKEAKIRNLHKQASKFGFKLVPVEA